MSKSFEAVEIPSYKKGKIIIDNWNEVKNLFKNDKHLNLDNEKNKLINYLTRSKTEGVKAKILTSYKYSKGKKGASRQIVQGVGLQNLMREMRHTIAKDYYYDIDMVNSEPTLLLNYCIKAILPHEGIKNYIFNREECFKEFSNKFNIPIEESKKKVKQAVIKLINGGAVSCDIDWFNRLEYDVKIFHMRIKNDPNYSIKYLRMIEEKKGTGKSAIGSLITDIFFNIENECLLKCIDFLKENDISIKHLVLCQDGFMIPKEDINLSDGLLKNMNEYIRKKIGYIVKYTEKPMDEDIDISNFSLDNNNSLKKKEYIAENDDEASEILLEEMEGNIVFCNNQIWIKTECDRIYFNDKEQIENELINRCMNLNIMLGKKDKNYSYSKDLSNCKTIVKTAVNKISTRQQYRNEDFYEKLIINTRDKIFFKNGFIQMPEMICINDENDNESITPVRIPYILPHSLNDIEGETLVLNKILLPIFGTIEKVNNYLQHIARGITGHIEDKQYCCLDGLRNSGKGVLTDLNHNTFCCYFGITSANNFLIEKNHTIEDPKKYSWLSQTRWCRLLHTSEIKFDEEDKNIKIDGNLIKGKLSSGGDYIEVRDLYQKTIRIKPLSKLFIMCNDLPPISPPDAIQTMSRFRMPNKFINSIEYNNKKTSNTLLKYELEADEKIKDLIFDRNICNAYLYLVLKAYKEHKVNDCNSIVEDTEDLKTDLGDEFSVIKQYFKFGNSNDFILSSDLLKFHSSKHMKLTITKLKSLLIFNGALENKHLPPATETTKRGSLRGFSFVSFIKEEDIL